MRYLCLSGAALLLLACGGGAAPAAQSPPSSAAPAAPSGAGAEAKAAPRDVLGARDDAVPPPPPFCAAGEPLPTQTSCADARERLALALSEAEPTRALGLVEACSEFEPGLIRALRAELGPVECGDALVESVVGNEVNDSTRISQSTRELLLAHGIAARLRRLAGALPGAPPDRKKASIERFLESTVFPWAKREAVALERLARQGSELRGYARGVAAVEAGMADMRFVSLVRDVPIPEEMEADEEVREVYYTSLEEALDARKNRGRDASLVGLIELERAGVVFDARVERARELLTRVFGGSRLRALDALLIPNRVSREQIEEPSQRIAATVPAPYVPLLIGDVTPTGTLLRALSRRGIPPGWDPSAPSSLTDEERLTLAWTKFHRGRVYFRSSDFLTAAELAQSIERDSALFVEAQFLRALGLALASGPNGPVDVMRRGSFVGASLGSLEDLSRFAEGDSSLSGAALFDHAYLSGLALPPGASEDWGRVAGQYRRAASKLMRGVTLASLPDTPPDLKAYANEAAKTAEATRAAIRADLKGTAPGPAANATPKN